MVKGVGQQRVGELPKELRPVHRERSRVQGCPPEREDRSRSPSRGANHHAAPGIHRPADPPGHQAGSRPHEPRDREAVKVANTKETNMNSFSFSFFKSGAFWSSVVLVLSAVFTSLATQYPAATWIGIVVTLL